MWSRQRHPQPSNPDRPTAGPHAGRPGTQEKNATETILEQSQVRTGQDRGREDAQREDQARPKVPGLDDQTGSDKGKLLS